MNFTLAHEYIELFKLLKVLNLVGSGGEAKIHISQGMVKVNEQVELRKRCKIKTGDKVEFDGEVISIN